ncbi:MAG: M43 family zinc metalloprotease [Bacteroidia bacterium]
MKSLGSTLLLLFIAFSAWSQPMLLCGTPNPEPSHFKYLEMINEKYDLGFERVATDKIYIPVKIHIVSDIFGNRYNYNTMLTVMCELNEKFADAGIYFYLKGDVNVISNSNFFRHTSFNTGTQMMLQHNQIRVVNIYFVDLNPISLCGYAYFPGSGPGNTLSQGGIVMSIPCSQVGNTTLAHEMGHYLALPHPFEGTSPNTLDVFAERVTRNTNEIAPRLPANCATLGDRFCDTPADYIGVRWNCNTTTHSDTDLNGDLFQPDPSLFMSYSSDFCMNRFSPQQINTMRFTMLGDASTAAPRGYLTIFPMPAWDTIRNQVTLLQPLINDPPSPSNWVFFKWTQAIGATKYHVRIRLGQQQVTEFISSDTSYLFTISLLQPGQTYNYTVRPYNHGWTCMGPSQSGQFTTTQGYAASVFDQEKADLLVYPNLLKSGEQIHIRAIAEMHLLAASLLDQHGRVVHKFELDPNERLHTLNVPHLSSGMYQLRLEGNGNPRFERLVIH